MSDKVKGILVCTLLLAGVVGWVYLKVEAYGGDPSCLFIRCVKVIH